MTDKYEIKEYYKKIYAQKQEEYLKACDENRSFIELHKLLGELVEAKLNYEDAVDRYQKSVYIPRLEK